MLQSLRQEQRKRRKTWRTYSKMNHSNQFAAKQEMFSFTPSMNSSTFTDQTEQTEEFEWGATSVDSMLGRVSDLVSRRRQSWWWTEKSRRRPPPAQRRMSSHNSSRLCCACARQSSTRKPHRYQHRCFRACFKFKVNRVQETLGVSNDASELVAKVWV